MLNMEHKEFRRGNGYIFHDMIPTDGITESLLFFKPDDSVDVDRVAVGPARLVSRKVGDSNNETNKQIFFNKCLQNLSFSQSWKI